MILCRTGCESGVAASCPGHKNLKDKGKNILDSGEKNCFAVRIEWVSKKETVQVPELGTFGIFVSFFTNKNEFFL